MGPDNESRTNGGGVHREREMRQRKANRVNIGKIAGLEREWVARGREFLSCGEFGGREARWEELGWTLNYGTGLIKSEPGACALVLSHLNFPHITAEYRFQLFKSEQAFFNKGALVNIGPDSRDKEVLTRPEPAPTVIIRQWPETDSYCNSLKQTPVSKDRKTKTSGNQTYINVTAVCLVNHVLDDLLFLKFP